MRLNGIEVHVENEDFGGILDWFSSKPKLSKEEEVKLGQTWINTLYNELQPNSTYQTFIEALKLDSYNQRIPEEDYRDFLSTIGYNVNENKTISDKVRAAIVSSLKSNKNGLPSRRSIISAFLNPNNIKITYWDATKIVATDIGKDIKNTATSTVSIVSGGFSALNFILTYKYPIAIGLVGLSAWFFYTQREKIKERLTEKVLTKAGLGK